MKVTTRGASPTAVDDAITAVGAVFWGVGSLAVMVTFVEFVCPSVFVTVRVVVYVPGLLKVWFAWLAEDVVPSPKVQE